MVEIRIPSPSYCFSMKAVEARDLSAWIMPSLRAFCKCGFAIFKCVIRVKKRKEYAGGGV